MVSQEDSAVERRHKLSAAITAAAKELGNTRAVCRSSYIHPGLVVACESGELTRLLAKAAPKQRRNMTVAEMRLLQILPLLDFQ